MSLARTKLDFSQPVAIMLMGVMGHVGSPDEDPAGFPFGGWQAPLLDEVAGAQAGAAYEGTDALLLGRRTYDIFAAYWPYQGGEANEIATIFNSVPKYVASRGRPDLSWAGSTQLGPDLAGAVREIRDRHEHVKVVGSLNLVQTLLREKLFDRLDLWVHPIVLGVGKKVFDGGAVPTNVTLLRTAGSRSDGHRVPALRARRWHARDGGHERTRSRCRARCPPRPVIIPTPREGVVLVTSDNAYDTSQGLDALVSAGATRPTLIGAYPGPAVLPRGFVSRANNVTPSIDPYLQTPSMPAGSAWTIDCYIIYSGANGAGFFKFSLLGPPSTEIDWYVPAYWNTANVELDHETSAQAATKTAYTYGTPAANQAALAIHGMIYPGTAGPMGLYWSQGTSNATGTRVWNGSRLTLTRVS